MSDNKYWTKKVLSTAHIAPPRRPMAEADMHAAANARLAESPDVKYGVYADAPKGFPARVAIAIRDVGSCLVEIPEPSYDGMRLFSLVAALGQASAPEVLATDEIPAEKAAA